jgi:hypothetical protein
MPKFCGLEKSGPLFLQDFLTEMLDRNMGGLPQ